MLDGEDTAAGSRPLLLKCFAVETRAVFRMQKAKNPESRVVGSQ